MYTSLQYLVSNYIARYIKYSFLIAAAISLIFLDGFLTMAVNGIEVHGEPTLSDPCTAMKLEGTFPYGGVGPRRPWK